MSTETLVGTGINVSASDAHETIPADGGTVRLDVSGEKGQDYMVTE